LARETNRHKLIKEGMDTREVVARFESERQAVALMDQCIHSHAWKKRRNNLS
jgi:hypothetical protein